MEVRRACSSRFIDLIRQRFNAGVPYKGRILRWDTVIEQKAKEVGQFLVEKSSKFEFGAPAVELARCEYRELGARILKLTQSEARELDIGKSTLHYLKNRAGNSRMFVLHSKTLDKLTAK